MGCCKNIDDCIFFNGRMATDSKMAEIYRREFCQGKFDECARYILIQQIGCEKIPNDLFPVQKERVERLIREKKLK